MKLPLNKNSPDDFQTPPQALLPLYPFLRKGWRIWEPACGKRNLSYALSENFDVWKTDILSGTDFLTCKIDFVFHCIITNPPFSLKQQFLERCYLLGKPFALLLPLTTFETAKRQKAIQGTRPGSDLFTKENQF